jgi:hypothetical protein
MGTEELRPHELDALRFLAKGPDTVGVIDSEEKLAAAIVFSDLKLKGLVVATLGPDGPTFHISPSGRRAIAP